jgi:hypothetical protein
VNNAPELPVVALLGLLGYRSGEAVCGAGGSQSERVLARSAALIDGENRMTTFDEREKGFEKKFAMDQDLKFRAEARRNKLIAEWAAAKLGLTGPAVEDYIKAVRKADLAEKGDDDVVRKIRADFDAKGIKVSDSEIHTALGKFLAEAVAQIEASKS